MEVIMSKRKKAFNNYEINKNIAKTLVLHRVWNGFTQAQLAQCIKVSFQQVQKYERCINRLAAENLIDICRQKKWDIQLFLTDKPETIFEEWCKRVPQYGEDTPYPKRASQIQKSWDKIDLVGEQNYYNEHSPRYKNIIKEMKGD
jgi:transcriptional regulator with XRE-family HTH domain